MGARVDPGAEVAVAMAEMVAGEGDFGEALGWLEVAGERGALNRAQVAAREEWMFQARGGAGDGRPRSRRRLSRPALPGP